MMHKSSKRIIDEERRKLLKMLSLCGVGGVLGNLGLFLPASTGRAQGADKHPFVVVIALGSWDGYASGLWQPHDANVYPKGAFNSQDNSGSVNPLINQHVKSSNMVFHNYSKVLQSMAADLCCGLALARSLQHGTAMSYQLGGNASNAGFVAGAAQVLVKDFDPNAVAVINASSYSARLNTKTTSVANVPGSNVNSVRATYQDATDLPKNANLAKIWDVHKNLTGGAATVSGGDATAKLQIDTYESALYGGAPTDIQANSPLILSVDAAMTRTKVNEKIDTYIGDNNDGTEIKQDALFNEFNQMFEKLKLAAIMAKSGLGYGIDIHSHYNQDFHDAASTSSSVHTARSAALVYAMVSVFWDWVRANDLQDDILVVITHEFGRTPYNQTNAAGRTDSVIVDGVPTSIPSKGTDHGTGAGYLFINGKVPAGKRFGAMSDFSNVFGSAASGIGLPDASIQAYTSTDLVGSMLLRIWGDKFIDKAFMRQFWGDFTTEVPGII